MAEPYVGEIRWLAGDQVPAGWLACEGQTLSASTFTDLFDAINYAYGGQGDDFSLPDLRGRVAVHVGGGRALGDTGGQEKVALTTTQMPAHGHALGASEGDGDRADPAGAVWARSEALGFSADPSDATMSAGALATAGAGAAHENMMPFLGLTPVIAVVGTLPGEFPTDPDFYVGEVRLMAFSGAVDGAPAGWLQCRGQALSPGDELADLLGGIYSGNPGSPAVPDLQGRVSIHRVDEQMLGKGGGAETHVLTLAELPAHTHAARAASVAGDNPSPATRTWGVQSAAQAYAAAPDASMRADAVSTAGGGAAHDNMPPFLAVNFCVSAAGVSPQNPTPMPDPFLGEVRLFAFGGEPPPGWAVCDGSALPVDELSAALFEVIGTKYGGDASAFKLPDLRGRAPLGAGAGPGLTPRALAETGGAAAVALTTDQLPAHGHDVRARSGDGGAASPAGNVFGEAQARALSAGYSSEAPSVSMAAAAVGSAGAGDAHDNMPPYLPLTYCISLAGLMP